MTISQMFEEVRSYVPHCNFDDAEVVKESRCKTCSGKLRYRGFKKGQSYRAFSVCEPCDAAEEF